MGEILFSYTVFCCFRACFAVIYHNFCAAKLVKREKE